MDLSAISKVSIADRSSDANEKLAEGWILLDTATGKDEEGFPIVRFALGFPGREPIG